MIGTCRGEVFTKAKGL